MPFPDEQEFANVPDGRLFITSKGKERFKVRAIRAGQGGKENTEFRTGPGKGAPGRARRDSKYYEGPQVREEEGDEGR